MLQQNYRSKIFQVAGMLYNFFYMYPTLQFMIAEKLNAEVQPRGFCKTLWVYYSTLIYD
jgi:hypothetical protein